MSKRLLWAGLLCATLAACGGGGGGDSANVDNSNGTDNSGSITDAARQVIANATALTTTAAVLISGQ
jgi:hypothetical protein